MNPIEKLFGNKCLLLAPMENVTNTVYRLLCRQMGADGVYTEFISSEGLIRGCKRGFKKMAFQQAERPIGIQIYGSDDEAMTKAALLASKAKPDFIDINAGCWVKKVSNRGAGAALLKNPKKMQTMIKKIVKAVDLPVTVKTRLGWDQKSIVIEEVAKRIEDAGAKALTLHCRTRIGAHTENVNWSYINKLKSICDFPIYLNGGVIHSADVLSAFTQTNANGLMIARGAIGSPWIFSEAKQLLKYGYIKNPFSLNQKINLCLNHLSLFIQLKGEPIAIKAFRRYYHGYLKGTTHITSFRNTLMQLQSFHQVKSLLLSLQTSPPLS